MRWILLVVSVRLRCSSTWSYSRIFLVNILMFLVTWIVIWLFSSYRFLWRWCRLSSCLRVSSLFFFLSVCSSFLLFCSLHRTMGLSVSTNDLGFFVFGRSCSLSLVLFSLLILGILRFSWFSVRCRLRNRLWSCWTFSRNWMSRCALSTLLRLSCIKQYIRLLPIDVVPLFLQGPRASLRGLLV
jgi:hypothetical protein